jgi:hypothetical protein
MAGKYLVTTTGEFEWPHIHVADTMHKAEGLFHVKLLLKDKEAEDFQDMVDKAHQSWKEKCLADNPKGKWTEWLPYKKKMDDSGMEVGTLFHFKLKASGINGKTGETFTQKPVVVGPDKAPLPSSVKVANGSTGKVAYEIAPYLHGQSLGLQLRLRMVQVLNLIEYVAQGAVDDVFGVEEGYETISPVDTTFTKEGDAFQASEGTASDF